MAVPDDVIFAHAGDKIIYYKDVRNYCDEDRLHALQKRLDHWMVGQTNELIAKNENGNNLVNSPFPLVIMSCITLETLGVIFFSHSVKSGDPRDYFKEAATYSDQKLKGPMEKGFKGKMRNLWPNSDLQNTDSAANVIFKFFRNTMVHGYQGKGVYITGEIGGDAWRYGDGYILIHPENFWRMIRDDGYFRMFQEVLCGHNQDMKDSALEYIENMVD